MHEVTIQWAQIYLIGIVLKNAQPLIDGLMYNPVDIHSEASRILSKRSYSDVNDYTPQPERNIPNKTTETNLFLPPPCVCVCVCGKWDIIDKQ